MVLAAGGSYYSKTSHPRLGECRNASDLWKALAKSGFAEDPALTSLTAAKNKKRGVEVVPTGKKRICWRHEYVDMTAYFTGRGGASGSGSQARLCRAY